MKTYLLSLATVLALSNCPAPAEDAVCTDDTNLGAPLPQLDLRVSIVDADLDGIDDYRLGECPMPPVAGRKDRRGQTQDAGVVMQAARRGPAGSTVYQVARAASPDFVDNCVVTTTSDPLFVDATVPVEGQVYYYLKRSKAKGAEWGAGSSGAERDLSECEPIRFIPGAANERAALDLKAAMQQRIYE